MQSDNAHLRIMMKLLQMLSQLDCLISSTFRGIRQLNHESSRRSFSGGMAFHSVPTTAAGYHLFVSLHSTIQSTSL